MGNPRNWTTTFNATSRELEQSLRAAGVRSQKKRREAMDKAASGRPADLAEQARKALADRRAQHSIDIIAGRVQA